MDTLKLIVFLGFASACYAQDQVFGIHPQTVAENQKVTLKCMVTGEGVLVNWYKRQGPDTPMQIATGTTLSTDIPPEVAKRMNMTTESEPASTTFILTINDSRVEDSGTYGCGALDSMKMEDLLVTAPVQEVLMGPLGDSGTIEGQYKSNDTVSFTDGVGNNIACLAKGASPIPVLTMTLGEDITQQFAMNNVSTVEGDKPFSRTKYAATLKAVQPLVFSHDTNNKILSCSAAVPEQKSVTFWINPIVTHAPVIQCPDPRRVPLYKSNVVITCHVTLSPDVDVTSVTTTWSFTTGSGFEQTLNAGEPYGTAVMRFVTTESGTHEMRLHLEKLFPEHFRTYTMFIDDNVYGNATSYITIEEDEAGSVSGTGFKTLASVVTILLGVILAMIR